MSTDSWALARADDPASAMIADPAVAAAERWRAAHEAHCLACKEQTPVELAYFANRNPATEVAYDAAWARSGDACHQAYEVMEDVCRTQALTIDGVIGKLAILATLIDGDCPDGPNEPHETDKRMVLSALADLRRLAATP